MAVPAVALAADGAGGFSARCAGIDTMGLGAATLCVNWLRTRWE